MVIGMTELEKREFAELMRDVMSPMLLGVEKRIDGVEQRIDGVEQRLTARIDGVEQRLDGVASDVKLLKLKHENEVMPAIRQIAEGHEQLAERLDMIQNQVNEVHQEQLAQGMALGLHLQQGLGYGR